MRLFGKVDSAINRFDRAGWLTTPFDKASSVYVNRGVHIDISARVVLETTYRAVLEVSERFVLSPIKRAVLEISARATLLVKKRR